MKIIKAVISAKILLATAIGSYGQSTFQNLDFELSSINPTQPAGNVSATLALPFWTPYIGSNALSTVFFNSETLDSSGIALMSTNAQFGPPALQGTFSVFLQAGFSLTPNGAARVPVAIAQTGLVPATSRSILFTATVGSAALAVSLGGNDVPFYLVSSLSSGYEFGGDISTYAGQALELRFTALPSAAPLPTSNWNIDSIQFSDMAIPEPSVATLAALGAVVVGWKLKQGAGSVGKKLKVGLRIED